MLNTSDTVPKVFMIMVPGLNGTPVIKTLFCPQLYLSIPGVNTSWDGLITSVQFPADKFYFTPEVRAPDIATMAAAWATNPQATILGPFEANASNTILIRTRILMIVLQAYVS
jgi:hypothetical protein